MGPKPSPASMASPHGCPKTRALGRFGDIQRLQHNAGLNRQKGVRKTQRAGRITQCLLERGVIRRDATTVGSDGLGKASHEQIHPPSMPCASRWPRLLGPMQPMSCAASTISVAP